MANVYTLDLVRNVGQFFISHPSLFGARIIYLTRQGVGLIQINGDVPTMNREFSFRTTGLFAYKVVFFEAAASQENIHIIYKI